MIEPPRRIARGCFRELASDFSGRSTTRRPSKAGKKLNYRLSERSRRDQREALQTTQPRASQHLASLRSAGLVLGRKEGLWTHYSLAPAQSPLHEKLLECLRLCSAEAPEL